MTPISPADPPVKAATGPRARISLRRLPTRTAAALGGTAGLGLGLAGLIALPGHAAVRTPPMPYRLKLAEVHW